MVTSRPNHTHVRAILKRFSPAADGIGGELELAVLHNHSPSADEDFLKPAKGSTVKAFSRQMPVVADGHIVDVDLTCLGGPEGGQTVVQSLRRAD